MKTKLFIFDMGGVLIDGSVNFEEIAEHLGIEENAFMKDYEKYDIPLMEGWMDTLSYMWHLEKEFGVRTEGNLFSEIYHPRVNGSLIPVLEMIREHGGRTVIGSNTFRPHADVIGRLEEKPYSYFDALYFSHEMHLTKPSPSFYRYILEKEGVDASEAFFVDDREENTTAAEREGIRTFLYRGERGGELEAAVSALLSL